MSTSNQFAVESNLQPDIMNMATVQLLRNLFLHSLFQTDKKVFCKLYIESTLPVGGVYNSFGSSNLSG